MKKLLSIILTILMLVTSVPFVFAADCVHDYSGEHFCLGYYCPACDSYYGEPNPNGHYWYGDWCGICNETHEHTGNAGTICMGTLCEICYYPYGEVTDPDAHNWNRSGTCGYCGTECEHPSYTDGLCDDCEYACPHSWIFGKCTECGCVCEHSFTNYTETKAPTCTEEGSEVAPCDYCDAMDKNTIPALEHKDDNGDGICDNDCGSEFAVIEGETYVVLGDITYTGLNYYITDTPGCYKAGDGYAVIKLADAGTELILYNATIDVREEAVSDDDLENIAVCVYGDLNVTFIGTNNIYAKEGYGAFHSNGPSSEDTKLVINGTEGAVLNLYGGLFGYYITVKSGTINAYQDDPDIVFAINADKYFTVEKDAVVTAVGADNEIFPNIGVISQRGMTVEGVLNAFTFEPLNAEEFSVALKVFGDVTAQQDIDVSLAAQEGAAIDLVISEGASLTIPEGCTINLDSFNIVDIKGELIVNGTLICTHEGQNGSCQVCGANLGKLVIDVTDKSSVEIGNGYDYYDEDGYIITGTNQNASVNIIEETALTLSNLTLGELYFNNAPDDSVINITLDGTTEVTEFVSLYRAHLIFDGGETDIFKVPYFTTAGNSGSVTVNSGNIILDCVTEYNLSAIACDGGFTINGGTVTASNNYFYVVSRDVTFNGGELNIISTAADREAISSDITMDKGALLTVSAESEILYKYGNIVMADGAQENDYFFVRYDTESEFVPVYDIRAALDGKTYAEIKIDTHEHSLANGKCVCGVARADYTAFDAAVNELNELLNYDRLLTNWKGNYTENMRVYVSFVGNNRTEREQDVVDNATNTLNKLIASLKDSIEKGSAIRADFTYMKSMIDQINVLIDNDPNNIIDSATDNYDGPTSYYNGNRHNVQFTQARYNSDMEEYHYEAQLESLLAGLKDGTMLKADYTAIDEAIKAVDEALENATISEEMATELEDIKDQLDTLKEDENATMADVIELNERLEAIAETMDNCANGVHSFTKYEEETAPECGKAGKEVATCDNGCGETDEKEIPAFTHVDNDGDYECDHGCGYEFEKPVDPTPDEPADDTCDHICHSDNALMKFLWKIISFFYRLFNIQQYCDCGEIHYDAPIFG